ncbi:MAG: hypothetical protein CMO81_07250 [Waddliaceae bacterium]|nr:hypothetical protein [Waddliaceae bacterium]
MSFIREQLPIAILLSILRENAEESGDANMVKKRFILLAGIALCLGGCSDKGSYASLFESDLEFQSSPENSDVNYYQALGKDLSQYNDLLVEPVNVQYKSSKEATRVVPDQLSPILKVVNDTTRMALEEEFNIVERPGENVMRLKLALSKMTPVPLEEDKESEIAAEKFLEGSVLEADFVDALSGERLVALTFPIGEEVPDGDERYVEKALKEWAFVLQSRMKNARKQKVFYHFPRHDRLN